MNRHYLVIGCSRGLGLELSKYLLKNNDFVYGVSRTKPEILEDFNNFSFIGQDLMVESSIQIIFNWIIKLNMKIDGVVFNAGIYGPIGKLEFTSESEWMSCIKLNLISASECLRETIKLFHKQGFGNFVALSGGGATKPMARATAYAASKAGLVRLVESVANDQKSTNFTFNCVAPGLMKTDLLKNILETDQNAVGEDFYNKMLEFANSDIDSKNEAIKLIGKLLELKNGRPTGKLISAVWDNWDELIENKEYQENLEVHTLRRVELEN